MQLKADVGPVEGGRIGVIRADVPESGMPILLGVGSIDHGRVQHAAVAVETDTFRLGYEDGLEEALTNRDGNAMEKKPPTDGSGGGLSCGPARLRGPVRLRVREFLRYDASRRRSSCYCCSWKSTG